MRLMAIFLLCAFAGPVAAADTIADQAQRAYDVFAAGMSQRDFLSSQYATKALVGLDGRWARLTGPDSTTGIESYGPDTNKVCKGPEASQIASPDPVSLTVTSALPGGTFVQTFTLIAGSTFGESTPAIPYLTAIGIGPDKTGANVDQQRALALSFVNGVVQLFRPSPDIIVIARDRGYPLVFARCPVV